MTPDSGQNFAPWSEDRVRAIIGAHASNGASLLPILTAIQNEFGHLPEEAIAIVAESLNLSRADVHGVATFYHDFRRAPPGRHMLKLCRAEACQSMGGEVLAQCAMRMLGHKFGETSGDGSVTLESVYCLGLCACAPAALFDGQPVGRLDEAKLQALLSEFRS